jgi:hypothetical protein
MFFNADGTIQKVIPTLRGVGLTDALQKIEIDRYSQKSELGASIEFIDSTNTFNGWRTILNGNDAWVQYNAVDFGKKKLKKVEIQAMSETGGILQIRIDKTDGTLLSEIKIPKGNNWTAIEAKVKKYQQGVHHLVVVSKGGNPIEVDWLRFE